MPFSSPMSVGPPRLQRLHGRRDDGAVPRPAIQDQPSTRAPAAGCSSLPRSCSSISRSPARSTERTRASTSARASPARLLRTYTLLGAAELALVPALARRDHRAAGALRSSAERVRRHRLQCAGPHGRSRRGSPAARSASPGVTRCLPTLITSSFEDFARPPRGCSRECSVPRHRRHPHGGALPVAGGRSARRASARARAGGEPSTTSGAARTPRTGRIVLVTLAPEVDGAIALIEHLVDVRRARRLGHTAATPDQIARGRRRRRDAGDAPGQRVRAHAAPPPEHDLGTARGGRRRSRRFIVDGHHLPPATVKAMIRAKGIGRSVLVTDAIAAAGCAPGTHTIGGVSCGVVGRRPRLAAGHAVSRGLGADAGSRDRQYRAVHGPAHRRA